MIPDSGKKLLSLMFDEGEHVCVSHDGYGYHSVPVSLLDYETLELRSPNPKVGVRTILTSDIKLVAINPIEGFRRDENTTAFRSFLVEIDEGKQAEQLAYVWQMGMPYSACVFSGNKSLHFLVTLAKPLTSYDSYIYYANWILRIMARADQNTKNPTRSVRLAGAMRDGKEQKLVQLKQRIDVKELDAWLSNYEGLRPVVAQKKPPTINPNSRSQMVPRWVLKKLNEGIDKSQGRNVQWFKIALALGIAGYDYGEAIGYLESKFVPEYDFKKSEWLTAVKSGLKKGREKAGFE